MIRGKRVSVKKNKDKNSFDLLQMDGYDIHTVKNDQKNPEEFENYELDTTDFDALDEVFDNTPLEHKEPENVEENSQEVHGSKDINGMFEIAANSVLEAKNIFAKNVQMKEEIDQKVAELERDKETHERLKQEDYDRINHYKETITAKLREKKAELDSQIEKLKEARAKFDQERQRFEASKQEEFERVKQLKVQQREEIETRQRSLDSVEATLKLEKVAIENDRKKLELDRIKYEADKNELANNLLKFNELVSDFTVNMDRFNH